MELYVIYMLQVNQLQTGIRLNKVAFIPLPKYEMLWELYNLQCHVSVKLNWSTIILCIVLLLFLVFKAFDLDADNNISEEEWVLGVSIMLLGSHVSLVVFQIGISAIGHNWELPTLTEFSGRNADSLLKFQTLAIGWWFSLHFGLRYILIHIGLLKRLLEVFWWTRYQKCKVISV